MSSLAVAANQRKAERERERERMACNGFNHSNGISIDGTTLMLLLLLLFVCLFIPPLSYIEKHVTCTTRISILDLARRVSSEYRPRDPLLACRDCGNGSDMGG